MGFFAAVVNEDDVLSSIQVAAAKERGWQAMHWDYNESEWMPYEGYVPAGISAVDRPMTKGDGWYDLNGRRLNAKPTQRGMYIHQGRRILVK